MADDRGVVRAGTIVLLITVLPSLPARSQPGPESDRPVQEKPLLIPQVEGDRQGKLAGRAIACGAQRERIDAALQGARQKMLARVGGPFTEERYLPALRHAIEFETSLGRPSDAACTKALDAFKQFEAAP